MLTLKDVVHIMCHAVVNIVLVSLLELPRLQKIYKMVLSESLQLYIYIYICVYIYTDSLKSS